MNNWFLRTTGGFATWATREGVSVSPSAGTLQFVGQAPTITRSEGEIDGGGTFSVFVEAERSLFWHVLGYVESSRALLWQIVPEITPSSGTLRLVGQQPTLAQTLNQWATPTRGALRLLGQTPTAAVTGDVTVNPGAGSLFFVGQIPALEPITASPVTGTLRFVGQPSGLVDLAQKVASPAAGTLRFVAQSAVEREQSFSWIISSDYVSTDLALLWQRFAVVQTSVSITWKLYGQVSQILAFPTVNRINATAPAIPVIRPMTTQRHIRASRAA